MNEPLKVSVITGPGSHNQMLLAELCSPTNVITCSFYWPKFQVKEIKGNEHTIIGSSFLYDLFSFVFSALWHRVPFVRTRRAHIFYLYNLYDTLASKFLRKCDLLIGWSQVSLNTMTAIKNKGSVKVLEHPMNHVNTWMNLMEQEYSVFDQPSTLRYSLFTSQMVERMLKEYEAADYINVLSSFSKKTFIDNGVPEDKILVTPLGIDIQYYTPSQNRKVNNATFKVLYVGRLELLKGVQYLLQAYKQLNLFDAQLLLVGNLLPEIQHVLEDNECYYQYLGVKTKEELREIYKQVDVLVLPSVQEAFGLVLLEAMASGIPVITTNQTGGIDFVKDYDNGFVIPIRSVKDLKERISYLYLNRAACLKMGENARKLVENFYTQDVYGRRLRQNLSYIMCRKK